MHPIRRHQFAPTVGQLSEAVSYPGSITERISTSSPLSALRQQCDQAPNLQNCYDLHLVDCRALLCTYFIFELSAVQAPFVIVLRYSFGRSSASHLLTCRCQLFSMYSRSSLRRTFSSPYCAGLLYPISRLCLMHEIGLLWTSHARARPFLWLSNAGLIAHPEACCNHVMTILPIMGRVGSRPFMDWPIRDLAVRHLLSYNTGDALSFEFCTSPVNCHEPQIQSVASFPDLQDVA